MTLFKRELLKLAKVGHCRYCDRVTVHSSGYAIHAVCHECWAASLVKVVEATATVFNFTRRQHGHGP